jgi:hypothetical protein
MDINLLKKSQKSGKSLHQLLTYFSLSLATILGRFYSFKYPCFRCRLSEIRYNYALIHWLPLSIGYIHDVYDSSIRNSALIAINLLWYPIVNK